MEAGETVYVEASGGGLKPVQVRELTGLSYQHTGFSRELGGEDLLSAGKDKAPRCSPVAAPV
jgi:hypothetical protein